MNAIALVLCVLSLVIWVYLLGFRGQFWQADPHLEADGDGAGPHPDAGSNKASVCVVIPARDEADVIATTLRSLFAQTYPGPLHIIMVDDHSTDGTGAIALQTAKEWTPFVNSDPSSGGKSSPDRERPTSPTTAVEPLQVLQAQPLPPGWTGKLWALEQGTQAAMGRSPAPDYILLSDADIEHSPEALSRLVAKSEAQHLELASLMVKLRCESVWEKLLIPAFIFFFKKLYPFRWVNTPARPTAAAAGGCILIRTSALKRIGGIASLRDALIDDCTLAQRVKTVAPDPDAQGSRPTRSSNSGRFPIWLGLSSRTRSLRPYPDLQTVWDMVARTAYTQLHYSPLLLLGTLAGMTLVYLVAPLGLMWGLLMGQPPVTLLSLMTWGLMAIAYLPILRFYQVSPLFAVLLPAIAFLYTLMTLDSALRHWQGRGGAWKGRTYGG